MTASMKKWIAINSVRTTYLKIQILFHVNKAIIRKWWSGDTGT